MQINGLIDNLTGLLSRTKAIVSIRLEIQYSDGTCDKHYVLLDEKTITYNSSEGDIDNLGRLPRRLRREDEDG